jgi:hypothetical protein
LLDGRTDPESIEGTAAWVRQCWNRPSRDELILDAIGHVLESYGTEAIWGPDSCVEPIAAYANMGDTYAATVIHDLERDTWHVGCWGDFVEAWERREGREIP